MLFWSPFGNANSGFATIRLGDLFSCQTRLSIEIIFSLTLAISYEVSVHVLLRRVSAKRGLPLTNSLSSTEKMAEKRNIFLVGPMGAGKSTIGRQLAQQLNMEFYDSDQEIEKRTGADVGWVFDVEGEDGFRNREEKVINELTEKQGIVLATGGGSVKSRETRNRLSARGVVVYLETTIEKQLARTQRDKKRPLLQVEAPPREVLEALANERNPLYEEIADVTIRTDDQSAKVVANQIIHMLESN